MTVNAFRAGSVVFRGSADDPFFNLTILLHYFCVHGMYFIQIEPCVSGLLQRKSLGPRLVFPMDCRQWAFPEHLRQEMPCSLPMPGC